MRHRSSFSNAATFTLMLIASNLATAVDMDDVQTQVLSVSCALSGCHGNVQSPIMTAGNTFNNIVNVPSTEIPSLDYIEPGDPDNSYLVRKIQGTGITGARMPFGRPPLNAEKIQLIRDWVSQGALEMDVTDTDSDGIADNTDNCPNAANTNQLDADGDGQGDVCDTDDDGDGEPDSTDAFPTDASESADTDSDGVGDNSDNCPSIANADQLDTDGDNQGDLCETILGRVYLVTTSQSDNVTFMHIINSSSSTQRFTGTLYSGDGTKLGNSNTPLHTESIPPRSRLILTATQLEVLFAIAPWVGPALLEVSGTANFDLMTKLTSPSGLISNTNCVRQNSVQNIEGFDSENRTFVRFINQGTSAIENVTGTLYDASGSILGSPNTVLVQSLGPKEAVWRNRVQLSSIFGVDWNGEASLAVSADSDDDLRLLNLNFVNDETFFNFSCYEDAEVLEQTTMCKSPRPQACTQEINEVCGNRDNGLRCVTTPCSSREWETYSNACIACSDPDVFGYYQGSCETRLQ